MSDFVPVLQEYVYDELKQGQIRLLSPQVSPDGLSWKLRTVDLQTLSMEYDALSYTWGSMKHALPIVCDEKLMHVHLNLHQALPFLARREGDAIPLPIWIDAVCINQKNEEEKAVQLRLMNRIYRQAKSVWVWLGCADPEVQLHVPQAIALLPVIVEQERKREELNRLRGIRLYEPLEPLQNLNPAIWKAILHLIRNPWNQRVWIVQEAALANHMIFLCGKHRVDSDLLEAAVGADELASYKIIDSNGQLMRFPASTTDQNVMFYIRSMFRGEVSYPVGGANMLLRMALLMTGHSCSVAKDRVLGMLGLLKPNELDLTGINLHPSTSLQDLYKQFSTYILLENDPNETQFWWPYFNRAFTMSRSQGLPSWVPDLHHQKSDITMSFMSIDGYCKSPRVKAYQSSWRIGKRSKGSQPDEFVIRGKLVDKIEHIYDKMPLLPVDDEERGQAQYRIDFLGWEAKIAKQISENDSIKKFYAECNMAYEEVYRRTLFANNLVFSDGSVMSDEQWAFYRNASNDAKILTQNIMERNASNLPEIVSEAEQLIHKNLKSGSRFLEIISKISFLAHRQLFSTTNGRLGFAIEGIQPGDIVCVFHGASTPHIIRQGVGRDYHVYSATSDAYIHGLMHGKLDLESDDLEAEEEDIVLI